MESERKHRHGHFTHEEIADLAYTIWQLAGEPEGEALANWYEAEMILRSPFVEVVYDEK